jgi:hypothetical protein
MLSENWRPVAGWPGYEVSDLGRVRRGERIKALDHDRKGYQRVGLWSGGKRKNRLIHCLVAEAFIGPRPEGHVCRHISGDKRENWPANLCYGTYAENEADKIRHGTVAVGERHHGAKLSRELVAELRQRYVPGCRASGANALAREYGIPYSTVWSAVAGKTWI